MRSAWTLLGVAIGIAMSVVAAQPARVEAPPPRPECIEKEIVQKADAICIEAGSSIGNGKTIYTCFDKSGSVFIVTRTRGSIS